MTKWRFKACPRCGGDTFIDSDVDGWYEQCLLCSHRQELKELTMARKRPVTVAKVRDGEGGEQAGRF